MRRFAAATIIALSALVLLISCKDSEDTIAKSAYDTMYGHLTNVWAQSMSHADADTAFFGDSRVAGADWYSAYPDSEVVNLGVGGDRISDLLTRLPILDNLQNLTTVVVAIGGNDCLSGSYNAKTFRAEYDELLSQLQERGLTVYINTMSGICKGSAISDPKAIANCNIKIAQANQIIKELATSHSMTVIDVAALMDNDDGSLKPEYASDGVHFSAEGNQVWYEALRPYIPVRQ